MSATGTYTRHGVNIPGDVPIIREFTAMQKTMGDRVGQYMMENPAGNTLVRRRPASYSGTLCGLDGRGYTYSRYPYYLHNDAVTHLPITQVPDEMALYTEGAAQANPANFTGQFSPLVSLIELREIPRMAKNFLDLTWKRIASGYIEYSFGYAPIISDIKALFEMPVTIERRIAELKFLSANKGKQISRSRTVFDQTVSTNWSSVGRCVIGFGTESTLYIQKQTNLNVRVTTHWVPEISIDHLGEIELALLARDQAFSLTPNTFLRQAWDLLPWSWLIDYFTTLGDFIDYCDNSVAYSTGPGSLSRVLTTSIRSRWRNEKHNPGNTSVNSISFHPGSATRRDWDRKIIPTPIPSLRGPFLTSHQTSILASLASAFAIASSARL